MKTLTFSEQGMVVKGLSEYAITLRRSAASRRNAGQASAEWRAELRRLASKYEALAQDLEGEMR